MLLFMKVHRLTFDKVPANFFVFLTLCTLYNLSLFSPRTMIYSCGQLLCVTYKWFVAWSTNSKSQYKDKWSCNHHAQGGFQYSTVHHNYMLWCSCRCSLKGKRITIRQLFFSHGSILYSVLHHLPKTRSQFHSRNFINLFHHATGRFNPLTDEQRF